MKGERMKTRTNANLTIATLFSLFLMSMSIFVIKGYITFKFGIEDVMKNTLFSIVAIFIGSIIFQIVNMIVFGILHFSRKYDNRKIEKSDTPEEIDKKNQKIEAFKKSYAVLYSIALIVIYATFFTFIIYYLLERSK